MERILDILVIKNNENQNTKGEYRIEKHGDQWITLIEDTSYYIKGAVAGDYLEKIKEIELSIKSKSLAEEFLRDELYYN